MLITERRMEIEFAQTMKYVVEMYPDAEVIRVVLGNLNVHKMVSLYEPFPLDKVRVSPRIWSSITRPGTTVGSTLRSPLREGWVKWNSPFCRVHALPVEFR
mgnify:FL=1